MSATLITSLIGLALPVIVSFLNGWLDRAKSAADARRDGANDSTTAANKESTDALARMSEANAAPRPVDSVAGRLRDGTF